MSSEQGAVAAATRRVRVRPRHTPADISAEAVVAAVRALPLATASELAGALSRAAGARVSGRAVRFLAENAGASAECDAGGRRRYWMPIGAGSPEAEVAVRDLRLRLAATRPPRGGAVPVALVDAELERLAREHACLADPARRRAARDALVEAVALDGARRTAPGLAPHRSLPGGVRR